MWWRINIILNNFIFISELNALNNIIVYIYNNKIYRYARVSLDSSDDARITRFRIFRRNFNDHTRSFDPFKYYHILDYRKRYLQFVKKSSVLIPIVLNNAF